MALLITSVNRAIRSLSLAPSDEAAIELLKKMARDADLEPELLQKASWVESYIHLLEALGMTPKARNSSMRGGVTPDGDSDKITQLRDRRQRRAPRLDEAASGT